MTTFCSMCHKALRADAPIYGTVVKPLCPDCYGPTEQVTAGRPFSETVSFEDRPKDTPLKERELLG